MKTAYHYFFYGLTSEDQLNSLIQEAEEIGCEFVQLVPMAVPATQMGKLALAGRPQGMVILFRVFVRCLKSMTAEIDAKMKARAEAEKRPRTKNLP